MRNDAKKIVRKLHAEQLKTGQRASAKWPSELIVTSRKSNEYLLGIDGNALLKNMQEDSVAFEGWALVLKCWLEATKVLLSWPEPEDCYDLHYQRFLYRVIKFRNAMCEWFDVENEKLLEKSRVLLPNGEFREGTFLLNYEKQPRNNKEDKGGDSEDAWENRFINAPSSLLKAANAENNSLKRQLPAGLFKDEVKKSSGDNRPQIFPGGKAAIDLWAISEEGKAVVFELKKPSGNKKVGAISELLFYSLLVRDVQKQNNLQFYVSDKINQNEERIEIDNTIQSRNGVTGYLLMKEIHPLLDRVEVFSLLNESFSTRGIDFGFIRYEGNVEDCRLIY